MTTAQLRTSRPRRVLTVVSILATALLIPSLIYSQAGRIVNSVGKMLPADAAPLARQVIRHMTPEPISLDSSIFPYDTRGTILPFEVLLTRDEDMIPGPGAAERWESNEDATKWTFYLREGARWSDGRPVTAHDFVYAYRRMVDPENANIYAFFYYDLENARDINHGKLADMSQLGIRAVDDLTLIIETDHPAPYLPHVVSFGDAFPVPRWAVEKHGRQWTDGENIVTNSGFKLQEWQRGIQMTFVPDPNYNGPNQPYLEKVIHPFRDRAASNILPYETNEVDVESVDLSEFDRVRNDPVLSKELVRMQDPATWYLFFRTQEPPFNDIRVREAFTRAINREAIARVILRGVASPAYSMLPPGFTDFDGPAYKPIQQYDPPRAAQLMSEAGFPRGRGFPKQELWLRAPDPTTRRVAEAMQTMIKDHLGVDVEVRSADDTAYMNALFGWQMNIGFINFGADYLDPRNMLDMTWRSQPKGAGRQDWTNEEFDSLLQQAIEITAPERRSALYKQAEMKLVSEYAAAFVYHPQGLQLRKPYIKGYARKSDGTVGRRFDYTKIYVGK
ncbi:MAG: peptide ABC transporter substrate-binding protein [Candidatus Latescibacteria bacterium]|jgi:oligopeptide transport system substrate-binding protein|nr:peptide ABC transporter substrate-binding protein [Candidatus Latescibacterota bacterium]